MLLLELLLPNFTTPMWHSGHIQFSYLSRERYHHIVPWHIPCFDSSLPGRSGPPYAALLQSTPAAS
jgi:hypothetical protein